MFTPVYLFAYCALRADVAPALLAAGDVTTRSRRTRRGANMHYSGGDANHLEVMVVADADMARFHGDDLEHYIEMLMAEVCKHI